MNGELHKVYVYHFYFTARSGIGTKKGPKSGDGIHRAEKMIASEEDLDELRLCVESRWYVDGAVIKSLAFLGEAYEPAPSD